MIKHVVIWKIKDPAQFARIIVAQQGGAPVYLSQVADVIDGEKEETSISRINGRPSIVIDIQKAQDANTFLTWLIRGGGFFMMFLGIFMLFRPIVVFADVLPLFGTMLGAGIGLFAFLGAAILSFLTIAVAWVVYRPFVGMTMIALAIAAFYWLLSTGKKKKAARAAAMVPAPMPA